MSAHSSTAIKVWPHVRPRDEREREHDERKARNDERARMLLADRPGRIAARLPEQWQADAADMLARLVAGDMSGGVSDDAAGIDRTAPHPDALTSAYNGERQCRLADPGSRSRSGQVTVTNLAGEVVRWETAMGRTIALVKDGATVPVRRVRVNMTVPETGDDERITAAVATSADRGW